MLQYDKFAEDLPPLDKKKHSYNASSVKMIILLIYNLYTDQQKAQIPMM